MKHSKLQKIIFIILGSGSLLWFLIRVVPKPSRAAYPCQRAAYPIASAFVIWLFSTFASVYFFKKALIRSRQSLRTRTGLLLLGVILLAGGHSFSNYKQSLANSTTATIQVPMKKDGPDVLNSLPARVSLVQSDRAHAEDLTAADIEDLVREAIDKAGGLKNIINDGMTVVLKPNLVSYKNARPKEVNGVTTDYRVVQAVVRVVEELNPNGRIIVMEGSASNPTVEIMNTLGYFELEGVDEYVGIEAASGAYRDYQSDQLVSMELPDSLSLYPDPLKPNSGRALYYNRQYFEADVLISIPCLKNHRTAGITGAVKNVAIGCTPASIYANGDYSNPRLRSQVIDHSVENLDKWIHDYYAGRPVDFVVLDGLQGVSSGPGGAKLSNNQHNMRLVLAGKDALAVDAVAGLIIGHDPQLVNYLVYLHNNGLGIADPARIEVSGLNIEDVRVDFGFDQDFETMTKFSKFRCDPYQVSSRIENDSLFLSVHDTADLARMRVFSDGQQTGGFITGGFKDAAIPFKGLDLSVNHVEVLFEDRYMNTCKMSLSGETTSRPDGSSAITAAEIFPNPVSDILHIRKGEMHITELRIVDIKGTSVYIDEALHGNEWLIPVEHLSAGLYYVTLQGKEGNMRTLPFIKN